MTMSLREMRDYVFIEEYIKPDESKITLVTCRCCERQKEFPFDTDLSVIEPFVKECILCREEGVKHG
jgi:hypothetical protein